ncbi:hypothetical protein EJ08DRAFT_708701 [Tothia fuscella]|uniref:Uncharacterized protein n=1 Tax=Tothia fuscella TaxID=1048955 RepID=A0A9P4U0Z1_9PEZI|nr:hypothetical protein EJ08DRAFT_708701 [Tothia fuscella]
MPPIPVYANTPLHPDGVTPKTAAPDVGGGQQDVKQPNPAPTATTTTAVPSTTHDPSVPPPPQPGARPTPPTSSAAAPTSSIPPPPPQPGAIPSTITATYTTTHTTPLPPPSQFSIPTPNINYAPTHTTTTTTSYARNPSIPPLAQFSPAEAGAGAGADGGSERRSLEHPPGYVQNPYAVDGTAQDRARFESAHQEAREEEGVMGMVRGFVGRAGSVAKGLEEGAWKFIDGKGGK